MSWFLEMEYTPAENAVKMVEATTNHLEYCINLIDKATSVFERIDSNFKRSSAMVKCYQKALHATEKSLVKVRVNLSGKLRCCFILRNCHCQPNLQQPLPSTSGQDFSLTKRLQLFEDSDDG